MRYGVPYKGSKNQIAEWVVANLPRAEYFVDLFCGGCAVTHAALLSRKWERFIINDIDGRMPKLFLDAVHGKYTVENHPEWVSREEFHAKKESDVYVALVWSFGNNGKDYIYGEDVEEHKRGLHYAVFYDDLSVLKRQGVNLTRSSEKTVYGRYADYKGQIRRMTELLSKGAEDGRCEQLERLQQFEHLARLQSLQSLQSDYMSVSIPDGAVIYCDPPYSGTNCGKYDGFDSRRFHEWARRQDNIFISEYNMPDDFIIVDEIEKTVLSAANGNSQKAIERLYTNERTYNRMSDRQKRIIALNGAQQLSLFDMGVIDT